MWPERTYEERLPKLEHAAHCRGSEWPRESSKQYPTVSILTTAISNHNKVKVQIRNITVECLVDTGAVVTVLGLDLFNKIRHLSTECSKLIHNAVTADGSILNVKCSGEVDLTIDGSQFKTRFHVMPQVPHQLILSTDFFKRHRVVLDFHEGHIIFKGPHKVCFSNRIKVPTQSEMLLLAKINSKFLNSTQGELIPTSTLSKLGLVVAHSVCSVSDGTIPILVLNPGHSAVTIRRNTTISSFWTLSPASIVPAVAPLEATNLDTGSIDSNSKLNIETSVLSDTELLTLKTLLRDHSAVFAQSKSDVGRTDIVKHSIEVLPGQAPRRSVPFRANPIEREIIKNEIEACLDSGVIRPSKSPWSSPVVLVKKPYGSHRFCIDYRKLNSATKSDVYPLPRIADALDTLGTAKPQFFSTLDLKSGYWQVEMEESSKEFTAFTMHCGLYEYNRMPFGLKNAPGTFQRLMESVLRTLNWRQYLVYLDDVIVFSRSFKEHLDHLKETFDCIKNAGLKLKASKCYFAQTSVKYLGHIVSRDGVAPCPEKCEAVKSFPTPTDVKSLRSFLGLANYYRKFVKGFSQIAAGHCHQLL